MMYIIKLRVSQNTYPVCTEHCQWTVPYIEFSILQFQCILNAGETFYDVLKDPLRPSGDNCVDRNKENSTCCMTQ